MRDAGFVVQSIVYGLFLANFSVVNLINYPFELLQIDAFYMFVLWTIRYIRGRAADAQNIADAVFNRINSDFKDSAEFLSEKKSASDEDVLQTIGNVLKKMLQTDVSPNGPFSDWKTRPTPS